MAADLDEIVNLSEKLLSDIGGENELPRISRSLDQMRTIGQKIHLVRDSKSETKAARLLGSKMSYELPAKLSDRLETSEVAETFASPKPLAQQDVRSYLKSLREKAILEANEFPKESAFSVIQEKSEKFFNEWWASEMTSILSTLSGSNQVFPLTGGQLDAVSGTRFQKKNLPKLSSGFSLSREEILYMQLIQQYQTIDFSSQPVSTVLNHFCKILQESDGQQASFIGGSSLIEVWILARDFLQRLPQQFLSKSVQIKSSEQVSLQRNDPQFCSSMVNAALDILGAEFVDFMRVSVSHRTAFQRIGGRPSITDLIRAFYLATSTENRANIEFDDGYIDQVPILITI
ncbi:Nucleoporin nup93 [Cichlidogyrus casuarinus]|uniref:Nucleoporin nup93 n=1 Tax=Cichlidogyrus casuarinus TaxID=1844966 RepID=A0ABD2QC66_9PLAT